ncbi:MAG TPA: phage/plasmid primase, P4 family [Acidocella sp.]|nr:phage/plasmid primase, P4 family [Acidocella sp.]
MNTDTATEEILTDGKTVTRNVDLYPAIPRPGEGQSEHAFRLMKLMVDSLPDDGQRPARIAAAVRFLRDMDPAHQHEAERYIREKSGMTIAAIRAQLRYDREQFPADEEPKDRQPKVTRMDFPDCRLTQLGTAEWFAERYGKNLRWCEPWNCWQRWDGRRWSRDDQLAAERTAMLLPQVFTKDAENASDPDKRKALRDWANACERISTIRGILEFAKALLPTTPDQLDGDPWLLNVHNGTLDLKTGELKPHDRADMITKLVPIDYDPNARCPLWEKVIREVSNDDDEVVEFKRRFYGYCLSGDISEHLIPIWYGVGRNGKSTEVETVLSILGDYGDKAPDTLFAARGIGDSHPTELALLHGKRLVVGSETEENARLRISKLKELSGDRFITARFMRQDFFRFERTSKLLLLTNHKPTVPDGSDGAWQRIRLVPFNRQFIDRPGCTPPDKELFEKLKAEAPGILAWMVRGFMTWLHERTLTEPAAVVLATASYRADEDAFERFLAGAVVGRGGWTATEQLRTAFEEITGERWTRKAGERLKGVGCEPRRGTDEQGRPARGWSNIILL